MRHGRKSKSKRFDGYKEHIAADLDSGLIVACAVTPANVPEDVAAPQLGQDMRHQRIRIAELSVDRAYINSELVTDVEEGGGSVVCKPWSGRVGRKGLFKKADFKLDMRSKTITCPAGKLSPSRKDNPSSSIPNSAAPAGCPPNAPTPLPAVARFKSQKTNVASSDSGASHRHPAEGSDSASASASSTGSPTSQREKVRRLAIEGPGPTCSIYAAPPPSRTLRQSNGWPRNLGGFKPFGALGWSPDADLGGTMMRHFGNRSTSRIRALPHPWKGALR